MNYTNIAGEDVKFPAQLILGPLPVLMHVGITMLIDLHELSYQIRTSWVVIENSKDQVV